MERSIYDLAVDYIELYIMPKELDNQMKKKILKSLKRLLSQGYTDTEIMDTINDYIEYFPDQEPSLGNRLFHSKPKEYNLLNPDKFYYHPQLRIMPRPSKKEWNIDTGEITAVVEPYFLELRASYTLNDLYKYYLRQMGLSQSDYTKTRMQGGLKWLLKQHSIDLVLFMIDIGANLKEEESKNKGYFEPVELSNYIKEAHENMGSKITEERWAGDDKIVPRKRVLSCRNK